VEALHGALEQALADPAVGAGLREQGYTLAHQTPGEFQALISADIDRYAAVTRALGLKAD
jgi:tripartite-type tricarboxylate transporter receptor subunit TctC